MRIDGNSKENIIYKTTQSKMGRNGEMFDYIAI